MVNVIYYVHMENQDYQHSIHAAWEFPETEHTQRSKRWYIISGIFAALCLISAILTGNFLFAGIIVMAAFIYVYSGFDTPLTVQMVITEEGIFVGRRYYAYNELMSFWILFRPSEGLKELYIDFKGSLRPTLAIPLKDQDPLAIRQILLNYLPENLEEEEEPMSEMLSKFFKL